MVGSETQGKKILVIDDDEQLQRVFRKIAEANGMIVQQALDGQAGLDAARRQPPDVILLDIMMPTKDGRDVLKELKADPATQDIPVIMLSARGEQSDRLVGLELGAEDYIDKPFSVPMVVRKIEYALWKRSEGHA